MTRRSGRLWRPSRWVVTRAVLLSCALALGGVAVSAASASKPGAAPPPAVARFAYTCQFPSGRRDVSVEITAAFPAVAAPGGRIQPRGVTVTVTMPPAAVASLARLRARQVRATAGLAVRVTQGGAASTADWSELSAPDTPLPARGPLAVAASGPVPPVVVTAHGAVAFAAGGLILVFRPGAAGVPSPSPSPATSGSPGPSPAAGAPRAARPVAASPVISVACDRAPGQGAGIAAVPVRGARQRASSHRKKCQFPQPKKGLPFNRAFPFPKHPKGVTIAHPPPGNGCAYVVGYSNVRKLGEAALVGPGYSNLSVNKRVVYRLKKPSYYEFDSVGQLDYRPCRTCRVIHGLPPGHATFLAFGFMPVSATMQLTEIGTINIFSVGNAQALSTNTVWSSVSLRVYNVKVNGTPLDVGSHCQTVSPISMKLVGLPHSSPPYSIQEGGPLAGYITIPTFRGCGVGENLDPVFNASISGPGNFVLLTQGRACFVVGTGACPPPIPKPLHSVRE